MPNIKIDTKPVEQFFKDIEKQVPYALASTLNNLANDIRTQENAHTKDVFKNPRPFTQNDTVFDKATKSNLEAVIRIKDAQAVYLNPYENGGIHATPGKGLLVPVDAKTDQYGQLTKGSAARLFALPNTFVKTIRGTSGLWQATSPTKAAVKQAKKRGQRTPRPKLKLLLEFGKNSPVTQHLDFAKIAEDAANRGLLQAMQAGIQRTIDTMKIR